MRHSLFLLILLGLSALAPASAQTPDSTTAPRLVVQAEAPRRHGQTVAAASLGALGSAALGYSGALLVVRPSIFELDRPEMLAASLGGLALGAAAGASLDRKRSFWRALGGAALGQAVGFGVGALMDGATGGEIRYLTAPVGAVAGATWSTR